jgi:hypothetical protein
MDQREEDRAALDRADKDVKEQVFKNDFEMEVDGEEEKEKVPRLEELNKDKAKKDKMAGEEEGKKGSDEREKREKKEEGEKDFVRTAEVGRGTETLIMRKDVAALPAGLTADTGTDLSLAPISLVDSEENTGPVMSHLSHQLRKRQLKPVTLPSFVHHS